MKIRLNIVKKSLMAFINVNPYLGCFNNTDIIQRGNFIYLNAYTWNRIIKSSGLGFLFLSKQNKLFGAPETSSHVYV